MVTMIASQVRRQRSINQYLWTAISISQLAVGVDDPLELSLLLDYWLLLHPSFTLDITPMSLIPSSPVVFLTAM